jgi:hypothetical protein
MDRVTIHFRWITGSLLLLAHCAAWASKPAIVNQPASQIVSVGQTASFSVTATGTAPLSYQWRLNGTNIIGDASTNLIITNVALNDGGAYSVVVSNHAGSVGSSNADLTVGYPPLISSAPASLTLPPGSDAVLSAAVTGTPPFGYRWQFNGADLPGANGPTLFVEDVQPAKAGIYIVIVTNIFGSAVSIPAAITVVGQNIVIDFETLPLIAGTFPVQVGRIYREKGFVLSHLDGVAALAYWPTNSPNYPGSPALFVNSASIYRNYLCLSRGDAGAFDLSSIDLCPAFQGAAPLVTLKGYNGLSQIAEFQTQLETNCVLQTFHLLGFTNLTEVRWLVADGNQNYYCQCDNLNVVAKPGNLPSPRLDLGPVGGSVLPLYLSHLRVGSSYRLNRTKDLNNWETLVLLTAYSTFGASGGDLFSLSNPSVFYTIKPAQ